jgi:hypothetical protein
MRVMRKIRQTIFAFTLVAAMAFGVAAQSDDQKKPPPKGNPPIVKPGDKPKPPKGGGKPKPGSAYYLV